ncbi:OLC1v1011499C3 [Oldenlandia corymbosa var. corymbosa]|uniref:OLC1v1011499C3 n=1 Tax=Oldenlandia corymbosa var. corymbosa TaxID=529605 RepID=A0AAV1DUD6_OLDCO|nr:OLC1v1011499C3 [Oldenlandia corymbosa var. corymbosa]
MVGRIYNLEIPSDIIVHAGGTPVSLHKFPLVSKCGYIRKMVTKTNGADVSVVEIPDIPGGAEAFELCAKFCYGINFEISTENVAMLRCAAEYLEMTEDYGIGNLMSRTEAFLTEVGLKSLASAVSILHSAENFLAIAEEIKLVSQCIDTIARFACKDNQFSACHDSSSMTDPKAIVDWWAEDLTVLRIDIFQRVLVAMVDRGFKQISLGPILMIYVQKSLRGLEIFGKGRKKMEPRQEQERRVVIETIVSLLPRENNSVSVSFLSMLLRASICLNATVACRIDLEKRIGLQLEEAVLDDLLIPSYFFTGDTLFDVETVQRILVNYLDYQMVEKRLGGRNEDQSTSCETERVGKLMENYLSEIASDRNLPVSKFIGLAELVPEHSRISEDGMYRAIDIFLKAHPHLSEMDRKKVCSVMDCQKLSREACAHAAQNDRLPVQIVVQVLYYEQQRLREAVDGSLREGKSPPGIALSVNPYSNPPEISSLRKENQDLKLELLKLKTKLREIERSSDESTNNNSPLEITVPNAEKPTLLRKSFITSVSKKLGKINFFIRADGNVPNGKGRTRPSKDRRHSIS